MAAKREALAVGLGVGIGVVAVEHRPGLLRSARVQVVEQRERYRPLLLRQALTYLLPEQRDRIAGVALR